MEPLTIITSVAGLVGTIFNLIKTISAFVSTVRNARSVLDLVSQELVSLQICLKVLDSDRLDGTVYGQDVEHSLDQVLLNIDFCCKKIHTALTETKDSRLGRSMRWVCSQKDQVNRLRTTLAAHKSTLQVILQMNTVAILVKEIQRIPQQWRTDSSSTRQNDEMHSTVQQMSQKLDVIAERQANDNGAQQIQEALAELSSSIKTVQARDGGLSDLLRQGCQAIHDKLATIEHVQGISEARTKMNQIVRNPFLDPYHEAKQPEEHETQPVDDHNFADTKICPVCRRDMHHRDHAIAHVRLERLQSGWRHQYNTQIVEELRSLEERRSRAKQTSESTAAISSSDQETNWTGASSATVNNDGLAEIVAEIVTLTSSWGSGDDNKSIDSSITVTGGSARKSYNTATQIQRLQTKYHSARSRAQMLDEMWNELEKENRQLHTTHQRDIERLKARLARAQEVSAQANALKMENEELRNSIHQLTRHQQAAKGHLNDQRNKFSCEEEEPCGKGRSYVDEIVGFHWGTQSTSAPAVDEKTTTRPDRKNSDLWDTIPSGRRSRPNQIAHHVAIDKLPSGACEVIARVQYHLIPNDTPDGVLHWSWSVIYFNSKPFVKWHISGIYKNQDTNPERRIQHVGEPFPITNQNYTEEDSTLLLLHVLSACLWLYRNDPYTKDTVCNKLDREGICREFFSKEVTIFKDKHFVKRSQPLTTYEESGVIDIAYIVGKDRFGYAEDPISPQAPADFDAFWRGDRYIERMLLGESPWPGGLLRPL